MAGGVETTNGISIIASNNVLKGVAPPGSQIILCDTSYIPNQLGSQLFADTTYANENGTFLMASVPSGIYNAVARNKDNDSGAIVRNIQIGKDSSSKFISSAMYGLLGTISGAYLLDSDTMMLSGLFYIKGTACYDSVDYDGLYNMDKIPPGVYTVEANLVDNMKEEPVHYWGLKDNILIYGREIDIIVDLKLEVADYNDD